MRVSPAVAVVLIETLFSCLAPAGAARLAAERQLGELRGGGGLKEPHFMSNTYSFLKTSGDRVGNAVQSILGVQGRIDDMVEDLSGEYTRWQLKQKDLLLERTKSNNEIGLLEARLLRLHQLRMQKDRLDGDMAVQVAARQRFAGEETTSRHRWSMEQEGLRNKMHALTKAIEDRQKERMRSLAKIANETNTLQQEHRVTQDEIARLNKELAELQEEAAKKRTARARKHDGLLKQISSVQDEIKALQNELLVQAQLQVEQRRLAAQSAEVAQQREAYEKSRQNCTQTLNQLDAGVSMAKRILEDASASIIACQSLDAANQKLQAQLSECKAANSAGQR